MELVAGWILFSFLAAVLADRRGRSSIVWFFLSILISPLFGILLVLALADLKKQAAAAERATCPLCAEQIPRAARRCPQCRTDLPERWDRVPADVVRRAIQRRQAAPQRRPLP